MTDNATPSPATTELSKQIEIAMFSLDERHLHHGKPRDLAAYWQDRIQTIQGIITTHTNKAYKKGYIDGGIDEILRHENARKEVEQELEGGE